MRPDLPPPFQAALDTAIKEVFGLKDAPPFRDAQTGEEVHPADLKADPLPICRAVTENGRQCRQRARHGMYCGQHKRLRQYEEAS